MITLKISGINIYFIISVLYSVSISQDNFITQSQSEIDTLKQTIADKEQNKVSLYHFEQKDSTKEILINLSGEEIPTIDIETATHVLAKPWYRNIDITGFGGTGFLDTGEKGTRPYGGFLIKEASLFLEGDVWEDVTYYLEIQTNRLGKDSTLFIRTGEVYIHFYDVFRQMDRSSVGLKIGRIDVPFGEEYLWQDASENPLISNSAAYPYGFDEGILIYGKLSGLGWIIAVTDGTQVRSYDDHSDKAFNVKVYGNLRKGLYLSASFMDNGEAGISAVEFGGSHFEPVGVAYQSSAGVSISETIRARLYEIDVQYSMGESIEFVHLYSSFGKAFLIDSDESFSRDWNWFVLEPFLSIYQKGYFVARYSEIGTYDSKSGYHFEGKTTAGGKDAFGYDIKRFRRLSWGLGWKPNPHVTFKLEVGRDWFDLIDQSIIDPHNNKRKLIGFEVVAQF